jgi:hypothetical protein
MHFYPCSNKIKITNSWLASITFPRSLYGWQIRANCRTAHAIAAERCSGEGKDAQGNAIAPKVLGDLKLNASPDFDAWISWTLHF